MVITYSLAFWLEVILALSLLLAYGQYWEQCYHNIYEVYMYVCAMDVLLWQCCYGDVCLTHTLFGHGSHERCLYEIHILCYYSNTAYVHAATSSSCPCMKKQLESQTSLPYSHSQYTCKYSPPHLREHERALLPVPYIAWSSSA